MTGSLTGEQRRRGRRTMFLLLAISLAPIVAAWLAFYFWRPEARGNYGELLQANEQLQWNRAASSLEGKWVLVLAPGDSCDEACRQNLHHMRQVRIATGKEMDRVARALVLAPGAALPAGIEDKELVVTQDARIHTLLARGQIHLVDPLGRVTLRYPQQPDARRMLKDLSRLLKYSPLGRS